VKTKIGTESIFITLCLFFFGGGTISNILFLKNQQTFLGPVIFEQDEAKFDDKVEFIW